MNIYSWPLNILNNCLTGLSVSHVLLKKNNVTYAY